MTQRHIVLATAIMTTLLALAALWQFRLVVVFVILSLVIAATFRPIYKGESRHNLRTRFLLVMQYLVAILVIGILFFIVGRFLVIDFQQLAINLSEDTVWILPSWLEGSPVQQALASWLPTPDNLFQGLVSQPLTTLSAFLGFTEGVGIVLSGFVIALFLSIYWSINQNHFERLWLSLLPAEQRKRARYIWRTIEYEMGAYTRSELVQSLLAIILLGIGYWLLGSPYPTLLAVSAGILWLIPVIGGILALILPLMLGLLNSPQLSLLTVVYTVVVLVAMEAWVEPRLFRLKANNQVLTFIILLAMADAFGLIGIIAAPPISVIIQILWRLLVSDRLTTDAVLQVSDLKERQTQLQAAIRAMEGSPPPQVVSSMERLEELLKKAEPILRKVEPAEPNIRPRNLP